MNINTNYPVQQINNQKMNVVQTKPVTQTKNQDVSFKGLPNIVKPIMKQTIKIDKEFHDYANEAGAILSVPATKITETLTGKTVKQGVFFEKLVQRFNGRNFGKPEAEREDGNIVLELVDKIQKPTDEHLRFVDNVNMSMSGMKRCFDVCEDNPEKIAKVRELHNSIQNIKRGDITEQVINSPNFNEYIQHSDKYLPIFKDCTESEGIVKTIDKDIASAIEKTLHRGTLSNLENAISKYPKNPAITKENLLPGCNDGKIYMLLQLQTRFNMSAADLEAGDIKGVMRIYHSANKNYNFKMKFMDENYVNYGKREHVAKNEINELAALFDLSDKDPHTKEFLKAATKENISLGGAAKYLKLIDTIGPERLTQDIKTIKKIYSKNQQNSTNAILEHYANYKPSFWETVKGMFVKKPVAKEITPVRDMVKIDTKEDVIKPQIVINASKSVVEPEIANPVQTVKISKPKRQYYVFKPFVPAAPTAKKLVVINDVNKIIEKQLGSKVLSEQKSLYEHNATKMRAGMLPEIFASIKETRAQERANGTFNRHKSVNNEEAVDLYRRINGKNKKLVNYMLKKRNDDGTRMYSIRDIREVLGDANKTILEQQKLSTKENRFSAKDEKAIYENLLVKVKESEKAA